jgi:hypothetical protein
MPLDVPRMLACCAAFGDVDGAQELNITLCVLILLYMCPHTTIYVSSYCSRLRMLEALNVSKMSPHTTISVSSYYHMCPHTTTHVSSYYYISSILILLCMCPQSTVGTHTHTHSLTFREREREREIHIDIGILRFKTAREEKERNQNIRRCFFSKIKNHTENRYVD